MPEKKTLERAEQDKQEGKSPSTQAGEFVREEMEHIREGKHGARSTKQAIAIGLSKARRAGVKLAAPQRGTTSAKTRLSARRDSAAGRKGSRRKPNPNRSAASSRALQREGSAAASRPALARQARSAAAKRTRAARSQSARMGARHRAPSGRSRSRRSGGAGKRR
ncbi:MAG TPA: DUF6496 domain-containing protein [Candidatus Polarisedimenticolia bacterium]|nr:DUF6496 domain-containing protein [Candidatus Polarisedimenticolia bacterium]